MTPDSVLPELFFARYPTQNAAAGASSVKIATLLDKPSRRTVDMKADYIGFEVENEFVVGFGMDFDQRYRCIPYVGVLKDECYQGK